MSDDREDFLKRWSRLKRETSEAPPQEPGAPPAVAPERKPPELPPVEQLTPQSDFKPFMGAQVDLGTRRAALKKLFGDSHFNAPDLFEPYSADLTGGEPIPAEMLKTLNQARRLLFDQTEQASQAAGEPAAQPEPPAQEAKDAAGNPDA